MFEHWYKVKTSNFSNSEIYLNIIKNLKIIKKKFKEIHLTSRKNYHNLYNYCIFMIDVFNNESEIE